MPLTYLIILAIIQGITEFLPISSSAHLILAEKLMGVGGEEAGIIVIAVHFGSLFAVIIYFRVEVARLFGGIFDLLRFRYQTPNCQLLLKLTVATIPVVALGLILKSSGYLTLISAVPVIASTMIIFGLLLYYVDKTQPQERDFDDFSYKDAWIMGFCQAIALIPGTSRSGATVTASRLLKFKRTDGAKIAMLMSIPTILAASALAAFDISRLDELKTLRMDAALSALFAFIAAYFALALMMRFLKTSSYTPYVIYRVVLGVALILLYI